MERNIRLDMEYQHSWGLVEEIPTEEITKEIELLATVLTNRNRQISDEQEKSDNIANKKKTLEKIIKARRRVDLIKNLVVTEEHKKLLQNMEFVKYEQGGDYVFIGVDGKRPFGNSFMYRDVARILEWELPNDDLSDKQYEKAKNLLEELPFALNKILKGI